MGIKDLLSNLKVWPHQKDCVEHCINYLEKFDADDPHAALNRLPTGSGKSGIITIVARGFDGYSNVLVLTPSTLIILQRSR